MVGYKHPSPSLTAVARGSVAWVPRLLAGCGRRERRHLAPASWPRRAWSLQGQLTAPQLPVPRWATDDGASRRNLSSSPFRPAVNFVLGEKGEWVPLAGLASASNRANAWPVQFSFIPPMKIGVWHGHGRG